MGKAYGAIGYAMKQIKARHLEYAYLLFVFGLLLWAAVANLYQHRIEHEFPHGFMASDSFWHYITTQHIYDSGSYRYWPPYTAAGHTDVVGWQPPLLYQSIALFSHTAGLEVYDSYFFILAFIIVLSVLAFYLLIKKINTPVALLSLPLSVFLFCKFFYRGFTWGEINAYAGSVFLIVSVWALANIELRYVWVLFGLFVAATALAHPSELIFLVAYISLYYAIKLITKNFTLKDFKVVLKSAALALAVSGYYLLIFFFSFGHAQSAGYTSTIFRKVIPWSKGYGGQLPHFGLVLILILFGLLLGILLLRRKYHHALMLGIFMLLISFTNFIGIHIRPFQTRLFWPVYLSVFMGLAIYQLMRLVSKRITTVTAMGVSFVLLIVYVNAYYDPIENPGLMNKYHWQNVRWIQDNTPRDAEILYLYGDTYDQNAQIPLGKRISYLIWYPDYIGSAQNMTVRRYIKGNLIASIDTHLPYHKSFFDYGYHLTEEGIQAVMVRDFCGYDYYVVDKASAYAPALAQYNLVVRDILLRSPSFTEVYSNELVSLLHNSDPGGDCLPEEGVSLQ
jgi:hypothetical protein